MCQKLLLFFIQLIGYAQGQFNEPNIALRKPAFQYPGDYCTDQNKCYGADLAVDGLLDRANMWEGHCTHTLGAFNSSAFWTVNFTRFYQITGIIVHNRIHNRAIGSRLRDFSVYGIATEQMTTELLYKYNFTFTSDTYDPVISIPLPNIPNVSGIRVEIPNRNSTEGAILTLCEVEVFSDLVCPNLTLNSYTIAVYTNFTNHKSIAYFNCTEGYELNETSPLVCEGWQWDRKPPACEIITCPFPPELRYGNYTVLNSCPQKQITQLPFNCSIEANCKTGYNLTQGETRSCLSSKQWSTPDSVCEPVKCALPYILHGNIFLRNGSVVYDDWIDYGTEIHVTCDIGYNISSAHTRICQQNGTLSGAQSECIVVMCDYPGNIANGSYTDISNTLYTSGHMNFSDTIYVQCDTGYIIKSGLVTRKCQTTGKWSDMEPECTTVTCQPLEQISDLGYTYSDQNASAGYLYGSSVNVTCGTGMIQQGSKVRRCTAQGTWDGTPSTCKTDSRKPSYFIGIVVGSVLGLVIIIVAVLVILKRRGLLWWRSKQDNSIRFNDLQNDEHTLSVKAGTTHHVENTTQPVTSENTYYGFGELTADKYPETAILIKNLPNLVLTEKAVADKLKEQYENLPKGMQERHLEALKPQNTGKNRYKGLYAYDSSRVVLDIDSKNEHDYINACYINGFQKTKAYIASQGPTSEILTDFWRMVWQTSCRKIVMLTNITELGKPKCHQYWPDEGDICYGNITVTIKGAEIFSDFIIRKFAIKKGNLDEREVLQYHFTAWPDKGVPKYASSLVQFRNKVKCDEKPGDGPLLVHCSAGVGRTGTFIALDYLTDFAKAMDYVDVFGCAITLRKQRVNLVQTLEQYVFLHFALVETLMLSSSALPSTEFQITYQNLLEIDHKTRKRKLDQEFELLRTLSPKTEEAQYLSAKEVHNRNRNRYSNILPVEEFIPKLTPGNTKEDGYVNAVFLPSYKEKMAFIITQTPLESTIEDFWKLVWEYNIHTIVMMNSLSEMHKTEIYWPEGKEHVQFGAISIRYENMTKSDQHTVLTLNVGSFSLTRQIKLIQCGGWKSGDSLPESPGVVLSLLELVLPWQRTTGNQTILVHCMNGADKSGLFCVIYAVLDRMKVEQDVAISHTIEEMRNAREQIIPSVAQYKFCHEAVLAYIQMNETYSNFTN